MDSLLVRITVHFEALCRCWDGLSESNSKPKSRDATAQTFLGRGCLCRSRETQSIPFGGVLIFLDTYRTAAQFVPLLFVWSFFGTQINLIVFLSPKSAPLRGALLGLVCVGERLGSQSNSFLCLQWCHHRIEKSDLSQLIEIASISNDRESDVISLIDP